MKEKIDELYSQRKCNMLTMFVLIILLIGCITLFSISIIYGVIWKIAFDGIIIGIASVFLALIIRERILLEKAIRQEIDNLLATAQKTRITKAKKED